jgi:hypothetical protein
LFHECEDSNPIVSAEIAATLTGQTLGATYSSDSSIVFHELISGRRGYDQKRCHVTSGYVLKSTEVMAS